MEVDEAQWATVADVKEWWCGEERGVVSGFDGGIAEVGHRDRVALTRGTSDTKPSGPGVAAGSSDACYYTVQHPLRDLLR